MSQFAQKPIRHVLSEIKRSLRRIGTETPELDARLLLQGATGLTTEDLIVNSSDILQDAQACVLETMVQRRLQHEPVSRILGRRAFWKSEFKISSQTLDPRADSEALIEAALRYVQSPGRILDLGTGSGCLLLSLLQEWSNAQGVGLDISSGAIEVAQQNARDLDLASRADFVVNHWNDYKPDTVFDVVVANPPYISEDEYVSLARDVKEYDPKTALIAEKGGLAAYQDIVKLDKILIKPSGYLFFEVGSTQAEAVTNLLVRRGINVLEVVQDLAGKDRCIVAQTRDV